MVYFKCVTTILVLYFFSLAQGQDFSPEEYEKGADLYSNWLVRGLHHESGQSAIPLGQTNNRLRVTFPIFPMTYAHEFGYSIQKIPVTDDSKFAMRIFGATPQSLWLHRLHFTQALGKKTDLSLSANLNPDIQLYGLGIDRKYNLLDFYRVFYLSVRGSYSQSQVTERFKVKSYAIDLIPTINLGFIQFFGGWRYLNGKTQFEANPLEFSFDDRDYRSQKLESFYGSQILFSSTTKLSIQYNQLDSEKMILLKLSFVTPSVIKYIPRSMQD